MTQEQENKLAECNALGLVTFYRAIFTDEQHQWDYKKFIQSQNGAEMLIQTAIKQRLVERFTQEEICDILSQRMTNNLLPKAVGQLICYVTETNCPIDIAIPKLLQSVKQVAEWSGAKIRDTAKQHKV